MRTISEIEESLERSGYALLRKENSPLQEVDRLCHWYELTKEETSYHYVLRKSGDRGSKTDWDQLSKERAEKRLKAAVAKKKKEQK